MPVPEPVTPRLVHATLHAGESVQFEPLILAAGDTMWYDPDDGSDAIMHSLGFVYAYAQPGRYTLTLHVQNEAEPIPRESWAFEVTVLGDVTVTVGEPRLLLPRELTDQPPDGYSGRYADNPPGILPGPFPGSLRFLHANMYGVWEILGTQENMTAYTALPEGERFVYFHEPKEFAGSDWYLDAGPIHTFTDGTGLQVHVSLVLTHYGSLRLYRSRDDGGSWQECGEIYAHPVPQEDLLRDDHKPWGEQEYRRGQNNGTCWLVADFVYVYPDVILGPLHGQNGRASNRIPIAVLRCSIVELERAILAGTVPEFRRLNAGGTWVAYDSPGRDRLAGWKNVAPAYDANICYCPERDTYLMFSGGGDGRHLYLLTARDPVGPWSLPRRLWSAPSGLVAGCWTPLVVGGIVGLEFELAFLLQPGGSWIEWWGLKVEIG